MRYFSQYRQDKFINWVVFNNKSDGFFVDIGAHDGVSLSNTYFFEKERGWKGVCFEPNPIVFNKLCQNRNSINHNCCVGSDDSIVDFWQIEGAAEMLSGIKIYYDKDHLSRINKENAVSGGTINEIKVPVKPLNSFPELQKKVIDYVSLDTEGNELSVLQSIDFSELDIKTFSVENNYHNLELDRILKENGFVKLIDLGCDSIFVIADLMTFSLRIRLILWKITFSIVNYLSKRKRNFSARFQKFLRK